MSTKKPILDQIKETIANKDQIREQILQNVEITRKIVEGSAKNLFEQTKQSKFFNETVIPLVESDKADKAMDLLNTKLHLKGTTVMKHIEKLRKDIVELKVSKAKVAEQVIEPVKTTQANENDLKQQEVKSEEIKSNEVN